MTDRLMGLALWPWYATTCAVTAATVAPLLLVSEVSRHWNTR